MIRCSDSAAFRRSSLALAISGVLSAAAYTVPASACTPDGSSQVFTVTGSGDVSDAMDGVVTLREAAALADARIGCDLIDFDPSVSAITLDDAGNGGHIRIRDSVSVSGPGPDLLTVNNPSASVFGMNVEGTDMRLSGLTFNGADATGGFGINNMADTLRLDNVVVQNTINWALYNNSSLNSLFVQGSEFRNNQGSSLQGGGFPTLTVNNSEFSNASFNVGLSTDGIGTITNSTFSGGTVAGNGGALSANLSGNARITIANSTISGSTADQGGGGIYISPGAGSTIEIANSTISGNSTINDNLGSVVTTGAGGGLLIANRAGVDYTLTVRQSTFSGNDSASAGGGIYIGSRGAGAVINIDNTTIYNNEAEYGGGIMANDTGADINLSHTVIAGNSANQGAADAQDVAVVYPSGGGGFGPAGNLAPDYSFFGVSGVTVLADANSQLQGGDPMLAVLANGPGSGTTRAHMPVSSSTLVDMGDPALADDGNGDQDGRPRVINGRIDIGAIEYNANLPPAASAIAEAEAEINTNFSFSLRDFFSDPNGDLLTYRITNPADLPSAVSISGGALNANFVESDIGSYTVHYQVCDQEPLCVIGMGLLRIIEGGPGGSGSSTLGPLSLLGLAAAALGLRRRRRH